MLPMVAASALPVPEALIPAFRRWEGAPPQGATGAIWEWSVGFCSKPGSEAMVLRGTKHARPCCPRYPLYFSLLGQTSARYLPLVRPMSQRSHPVFAPSAPGYRQNPPE